MFPANFALDQTARLATSAMPDAPVVPFEPERLPGRARITISALLRRTANVFADEWQVLAAR